MAILPGSIYIDRTFIPDPAMIALVTTSGWFLVAYCQTEQKRYLWLASLIGMLGFLTKITGLIVGVPMLYVILAILGYRKLVQPKNALAIIIASAIALVPVIAYYLWARYLALNYPPYLFAGNDQGNWFWNYNLIEWWKQGYSFSKTFKIFKGWMWTFPFTILILFGFLNRSLHGSFNRRSDQLASSSFQKAPWFFHWWLLGGLFYYLIGVGHLIGNPYNFHIINPPAAAFAGDAIVTFVTLIKQVLGKPASIATMTAMLLIMSGYGQKSSRTMYYPYAQEGYELGLALRQISQPGDLVTTLTNDIGDPVAIYYSQRRGWNFVPGDSWSVEFYAESQIVQLENLRELGADWLGIVAEQNRNLQTSNRVFLDYIKRTCELIQESNRWVIYRIFPLEKLVK